MYNGIGLGTARGSGTNGYVQRNLSFVRPKKEGPSFYRDDEESSSNGLHRSGPNPGILDHERKRKLEVKVAELEDVLTDQGVPPEEIQEKLNSYRKMLMERLAQATTIETDPFGNPK
ncbi:Serine/arginine repetitive matrix protein 2like, partial [Caligus rogercresseyi]